MVAVSVQKKTSSTSRIPKESRFSATKMKCSVENAKEERPMKPTSSSVLREIDRSLKTSNRTIKVKCMRRKYTDYGRIDEVTFNREHLPTLKTTKRKAAGGVVVPFPERLHDMLSEQTEYSADPSVISWLPHGRAFKIHKPNEFVQSSLSRVFKHTNLNSFLRQINLYGFYRINFGPDEGAYYHELFLRNRKFLTQAMSRVKVNGRRNVGTRDPKDEPDFYSMLPIGSSRKIEEYIPFVPECNKSYSSPPPSVNETMDTPRLWNKSHLQCCNSNSSLTQCSSSSATLVTSANERYNETSESKWWWYDYKYQCWRQHHAASTQTCAPGLFSNPVVSPGVYSLRDGSSETEWDGNSHHDLPPLPYLAPRHIVSESLDGHELNDTASLMKELIDLNGEFSETFDPIPVDVCFSSCSIPSTIGNSTKQDYKEEGDDDIFDVLSAELFKD